MEEIKKKSTQKRFFILPIGVLFMFVVLLSGCNRYEEIIEEHVPAEKMVLTMGIVPAESPLDLIQQWNPFSLYISNTLDIELRVIPLEDYGQIYASIENGQIDMGIFGSYGATVGIRDYNLHPIARPVKENNRSEYKGVILVREDSEISDITELEGESFAYVSRETSAGYFFPRRLLLAEGFDPDDFFSDSLFAGRHDLVIDHVMEGKVMGGAAKDDIYEQKIKEDPAIGDELVVIHESVSFPDRTFLINPTVDSDLVLQIQDAMIHMHEDEAGREALSRAGFIKFIKTTNADFEETRKVNAQE